MTSGVKVYAMTTDLGTVELEVDGLRELLATWSAARERRAGMVPARAAIDVTTLRACLGNLHLLDVIDGGNDFTYRVYGTTVARYYGRDMTGKRLTDFPKDTWDVYRRFYRLVIDNRMPAFARIEATPGVSLVYSDRLAVPLSADGKTVGQIMVAQFPREFHRSPDRFL